MTSLTSPATGAVGEAVAVVPLGALAPECAESAGALLGQGEDDGARRDVVHQQAELARAADPRGAVRLVVAPERYLAAGGEAERVLHRQAPAAPRAAAVAPGCRMR